jgi:hypothetical protein
MTGTGHVAAVSNGGMAWYLIFSPWRVSALAFTLLLPAATRSAAYQQPVQQSDPGIGNQGIGNGLKLTAAQEKDSYEIYSMLLRAEMPPQWNITAWAIKQETQTYPNFATVNGGLDVCLQPAKDQESIYLPLIDDYVAKNRKKPALDRKFDLPQYALIEPADIQAIQQRRRTASGFPYNASVIFHVSAVGFSRDGTRALVYVGHDCGGLCGGGRYHLLVKKDGQWQVDREYRGLTCTWAS